jgi:hypothetical protein
MFHQILDLLRKLIQLAQERNTLALESLSELRDINKHLREMENEQDQQTELLKEIAAALKPPVAGPAASLVLKLGTAVSQ